MVLTDREIGAALRCGHLSIDPAPPPTAYSPTAVDLTLASTLRVWKDVAGGGVDLVVSPNDRNFSYSDFREKHTEQLTINPEHGFVISPGQFVLGWTQEKVDIPAISRIAARVEGKSSMARLGIGVHVTAPTVHAGFKGTIQLEMCNHGQWKVKLVPGMKICQLIFESTLGTPDAGYRGQFQDQKPV